MSSKYPACRSCRPEESGLVWIASVCFLCAMIAGVWNVAELFQDGPRQALLEVLTGQKILEARALRAWVGIHAGVTGFTTAAAWLAGVPLVMTVFLRMQDRAMALLDPAIRGLRTVLRVLRVVLIAVFVFKFVRYSLSCIGINGGSFLFYGMALYEGTLFTFVMLGFFWLLRFLEAAADSVCTVRYTQLSGEPDPRGIIPGTVAGLFAMAAVHVCLALLYRWSLPMALLEWAMVCGFGLLGLWLKQYKSAMEWQLLRRRA